MHDDNQHEIDRRLLLARGGAAIAALCAIPRIASAGVGHESEEGDGKNRRVVLTMISHGNMMPGESRTIDQPADAPYGPGESAFRPELIVLAGTTADWVLRDILIGGRSQLSKIELRKYRGGIPGEVFDCRADASAAWDLVRYLDVVEVGEIIALVAEYRGAREFPFICGIIGRRC